MHAGGAPDVVVLLCNLEVDRCVGGRRCDRDEAAHASLSRAVEYGIELIAQCVRRK
jgi:hypothetical protein